jgi:lysine-specific histone demethylase 1
MPPCAATCLVPLYAHVRWACVSGACCFTCVTQGGGEAAVADLGGSIITGVHSNPLAVLARQLSIPLHDINGGNVPLFLRDGSELGTKLDKHVRFTVCK